MQIIDGYTGAPNIYADDIGEYNISLYGSGDYVLAVGEQLSYELVSNNEIKIKDGFFITQGRRGVIKKGITESCIIENGTQAENRNDLIVIEYAKDESNLVESHTLKVIKGIPGETAADPTIITGNIPNGAVLHQMPLYRVKLEGLNIVAVESLFEIGKVSPETVDPMLATEEGFAADAKLTGNALQEVSANIPFIHADSEFTIIKEGDSNSSTFIYTTTEKCILYAACMNGTIRVNDNFIVGFTSSDYFTTCAFIPADIGVTVKITGKYARMYKFSL